MPPESPPKAIGSLAKKQSDVTRAGTQRLKFMPVIPARRKKDDAKQEAGSSTITSTPSSTISSSSRGAGAGAHATRGRGRGMEVSARGVLPIRSGVEMTASGPFALGPSSAPSFSGSRLTTSASKAPVASGSGTPQRSKPIAAVPSTGPRIKGEQSMKASETQHCQDHSDDDSYSDQDDGVDIVDIEKVRDLDWMAPETLKRERKPQNHKTKLKLKRRSAGVTNSIPKLEESEDINLTNALDLSDSSSEDEHEDVISDFLFSAEPELDDQDIDMDNPSLPPDKLYFFQFPSPFPTFVANEVRSLGFESEVTPSSSGKRVSFKLDDDDAAPTSTPGQPPTVPSSTALDGVIGQLEIRASGAVQMRLSNGILLDVTSGTQPSFLQHVAYVDHSQNRISILGEVKKRFVVSPHVETLLGAMLATD